MALGAGPKSRPLLYLPTMAHRASPGSPVLGAAYAWLLSTTSAYVEKVRTQFLSLRQLT
jgi:hypothetical protein